MTAEPPHITLDMHAPARLLDARLQKAYVLNLQNAITTVRIVLMTKGRHLTRPKV